jgi:hypothetical protein
VRPDSSAPNEVQILMPLVSGLTAEIVFWHTLGLEVSRTQDAAFAGKAEAPICFEDFFVKLAFYYSGLGV